MFGFLSLLGCATGPDQSTANQKFWECGWWETCEAERPDGLALKVILEMCGPGIGPEDVCPYIMGEVACADVALFTGAGDLVQTGRTNAAGHFTFEALTEDTYVLEVLAPDGSTVVDAFGNETKVLVDVDEDLERANLYFAPDADEELGQCGSLRGSTELWCQDEAWLAPQHEWEVFAELVDAGGVQLEVGRLFGHYEGIVSEYRFYDVPYGTVEVRFHDMDIPDYQQENNPDEAALVERYSEGVITTVSAEMNAAEVVVDQVTAFEMCPTP